MAKDTFYFSHDYNVRNDIKIKRLIAKHGYLGYGIFWAIIEDLYNNANALPTDYECIAFDLRSDKKTIESIIKDFDLFQFEGNFFGSYSIENRLQERNNKSVKARKSALKRWTKDANVIRTHSEVKENQCEGNSIKESKVNESKVKESKEAEKLIFPFEGEKFKNIWNSWIDYRKEIKKPYKSFKSQQLQLNELSKFDELTASEMINQSITAGWQGIFELKNNIKNQTNGTKQSYDSRKAGVTALANAAREILSNSQNFQIIGCDSIEKPTDREIAQNDD